LANINFIVKNDIELKGNLIFEGATADAYETTLAITDPTADRTITFPNATGTVALTSALSSYATLASPTFTGTVTIPSGASIDGYLTTSTASSTYLTQTNAASTYQPLNGALATLSSAFGNTTIQSGIVKFANYGMGMVSWSLDTNTYAIPGLNGVPYRMAAGNSSFSGSNGPLGSWYYSNAATVTLPSGRFSVTPIITVSAAGSGTVSAANVSDQTSTYFTFYVSRLNATPSGTLNWTAVQMESGAAGG
jgi:hypothetical protein